MNGKLNRVTEAQVRRELLRTDAAISRKRARIGAAVVLATALLFGALAARFLFQLTQIRTDAMANALLSGDVVLCTRLDAPLPGGEVTRGALILVRYTDNGMQRQTVRRVIAMGGDEVRVEEDGRTAVNGVLLDEQYVSYRSETDWSGEEANPGGALGNPFASSGDAAPQASETTLVQERVDDMEYPLTVPEGMLFVMCDDRENLMDSRSSRFGLVKQENALALPRVVIWPAWRAGTLLGDSNK